MPSSRRRPFKTPEEEPQPRPGSSRRRASERRGVTSRERSELFSDPPEHSAGDELDSIGLHEGGGRPSSRRAVSERGSRRGSKREVAASGRSKRERRDWARKKVQQLVPVGIVAGLLLLGGIAFMIPGWIRNSHFTRLASGNAFARETAVANLAEDGAALERLLGVVRGGKFGGAGGAAAAALGRHKEHTAAIEKLKAAAESKEVEARMSAAFGLGLSRDPAAVETLAGMLRSDPEKPVRIEAARALGMISAPASVAALVSQAEAESEVRAAVQAALITAACAEAREQLVSGLGAPTEEMRSACATALIATGQEANVGADEVRKLAESPEAPVRAGAVGLVSLMKAGPLEEILPKALADKDPLVRAAAADAAGLRRHAQSAEALEKMLGDAAEKPQVKISAARALARIGRMESVTPLAACAADVDGIESVRLSAAEALEAVAARHKFAKLTAKGEHNDYTTHIKLAEKAPDPRWQALEVLVKGSDGFKGEAMTAKAFDAMRALAGRKLAPKADVWKAWMENKRDEARVLGEVLHLIQEAYKQGKSNPKSYAMVEKSMRMAKGLRKRAEPDDVAFFQALFSNICSDMLGLDPKKEIAKEDPPEPVEGAGAEKKEEKTEEEKKD